MLLYQTLAFTLNGKYKTVCKNNKFKISVPKSFEEFELSDRSYSVSDIQDYFTYVLKSMEKRLIILQNKIRK